jgi:hypothetical protein
MAEMMISGYKVLVDDEDVERVSQYNWWVDKSVLRRTGRYYFRRKYNREGNTTVEKLHRFIMGAWYMDGTVLDHKSGNTLDNRKSNLRFCTHTENARNKRMEIRNTSGYKGTLVDKHTGSIYAIVKYEQKNYFLGTYATPIEAALAYDHVSRLLFKDFARPNFPEVPYGKEFAERVYAECVSDVNRRNTSGYNHVTWNTQKGMWKARYLTDGSNGKTLWSGFFTDPKEASEARQAFIATLEESK